MASTYSSLKIELIGTGDQAGTWGSTTNTNLGTAIEEAIVGYAIADFPSDADLTISLTDTNASQTARNLVLNLTSSVALSATRNLIVPTIEKPYYIFNNTSGNQSIIVKTFAGTGITVPNGKKMLVYADGVNVIEAINNIGTLSLTNALSVASGGSGVATLTGIVKGNGTSAFTAATAGTDYVEPSTATSFTATQSFNGSSSTLGMVIGDVAETTTISATAATGTINYDVTTQSVLFYTSNASGNWTINLRGSSGTSMNTLLSAGQSITVVFLVTQGSTAYYNSTVQVDGTTSGVTTRWQGGTAPTAGNPSGVDVYTYTVIKTGSATFSVFVSQTQFK